jgi:Putative DNA-binding domain
MRFPKPPHLLSPEELVNFVRVLINEKWPESDTLDYKAALNYARPKDRIELAKDISSFANEVGGTVIYGVPETTVIERCGLELSPGLLETVENILLDGVTPVLPNLFINWFQCQKSSQKSSSSSTILPAGTGPIWLSYMNTVDSTVAATIEPFPCEKEKWRLPLHLVVPIVLQRKIFLGQLTSVMFPPRPLFFA